MESDSAPSEESETLHDDPPHSILKATEAIIFAAADPVSSDRIGEVIADVTGRETPSRDDIEAVVCRLNKKYEEEGRAFEIYEWGGGYRMATRSSFAPYVKTLFAGEQEANLSQSLLEALAVIAYRQPVTRPEVDFVRGVNSDYAIRKLMEMNLVDVNGRADSLGRPLLYETTDRFLEAFGLSSLDDLPTLREVEDLLDDPAFDDERAKLLRLDVEGDDEVDLPPEIARLQKESEDTE